MTRGGYVIVGIGKDGRRAKMATQTHRRWTREETLIVFNLYCRIPFKDSRATHPEVQRFAALVDRTPASVSMKIGNLGSFDPELKERGISGLSNASRMDMGVRDEFHNDWESLIDESDALIAKRESGLSVHSGGEEYFRKEGAEGFAVHRVRKNQSFFRAAILSAYERRCCITGIDIEPLLVASHIKPWAESDRSEKIKSPKRIVLERAS